MKKILVFACFFLWGRAFSYFDQNSKEIILNGRYNFSSSWVSSIWSACKARGDGKIKLPGEHLVVGVKNEGFSSGEYLTNIFVNRGQNGELNIAPVTFIMNGIFGGPTSGLVKQIARHAMAKGHHVVALGNPLGSWGLRQLPTYTVANFIQESEVYLEAMRESYAWLKKHHFTSGEVNLIGVSYGAFLAAVIKSMDSKSVAPFINGMVTLLSVPIKMGMALRNMDHLLYQTRKYAKFPDWFFDFMSVPFCVFPPRNYVGKQTIKLAKAIFGYSGFQRSLADQTILLDELYQLNKVPVDEKVRKVWRKNFTFSDYINDYATDLGELMDSSYGNLFYWLKDVSFDEYQIFSSLDDPLNDDLKYPEQENIFTIEYGGHYGFRGFKFYDDFLFSLF